MRNDARRFSIKFWLGKIFLLGLLGMLAIISWWLWDYSGEAAEVAVGSTAQQQVTPAAKVPAQTTPAVTSDSAETKTPAESVSPATPAAASFPFSFDSKKTAADFPGINDDFTEFTYDFRANSTVKVSRDGVGSIDSLSRDFVWEYTLSDTGALSLTTAPITFCSGASNCGIGNGTLEIIVKPAASEDTDTIFYIKDSGAVTEFTAVDTYTPLLESYTEVKE